MFKGILKGFGVTLGAILAIFASATALSAFAGKHSNNEETE